MQPGSLSLDWRVSRFSVSCLRDWWSSCLKQSSKMLCSEVKRKYRVATFQRNRCPEQACHARSNPPFTVHIFSHGAFEFDHEHALIMHNYKMADMEFSLKVHPEDRVC